MVQDAQPIAAPVSPEEVASFSRIGEEVDLPAGSCLTSLGSLHDHFYILLDGEVDIHRRGSDEREGISVRGGIAGTDRPLLLSPAAVLEAVSTADCRVLRFSADAYLQWVSGFSPANAIIVSSLVQRVRTSEALLLEGEKLAALGKMAATLAHELNNPAAAAGRAADELDDLLAELRTVGLRLVRGQLDREQMARLEAFQTEAIRNARERAGSHGPTGGDPLSMSDREDELARWLADHGAESGWRTVTPLARAGIGTAWLDSLSATVPGGILSAVVSWIAGELAVMELTGQISSSTARLTALVAAVKAYAHLDRAPHQDVDVHEGLESTLTMLRHRLEGIEVVRNYGEALPSVDASPGELNQVWTNLIDNAIEALGGHGRIELRTYLEDSWLVVEVADNGPGIPPEIQARIFEPFFTTKDLGTGMGLGLDICRRIVVGQHQGDIRVESEPGNTRFRVYLPVRDSGESGE